MNQFARSLFLCLLSLAALPLSAATVASETAWGTSGDEIVEAVAMASDGSTYLAGTTFGTADGTAAILLLKFGVNGEFLWARSWESTDAFGSDQGRDVAIGPDGSVYVTGSTFGVGGDTVLLKFSPVGVLIWQQRYGTNAFDSPGGVAVGPDGSVYIAGTTNISGENQLYVAAFSPAGTLVWQKTWQINSAGDDVAAGSDGSIYVTGVAPRPGVFFEFDIALLKIAPDTTLVWQRAYATGEIVDPRGGVEVAPDGSVYVAGAVQEPAGGGIIDLDALIAKFTADGTLEWSRSWGGRSGDEAMGIGFGPDGSVYLTGNTNSFGQGSDDAFVLRMSPATGRALDSMTWGGVGIDHSGGVAVEPGGFIHMGATAEMPPWTLDRGASKTSRRKATVTVHTAPLADASGAAVDAGGAVTQPDGSTLGGHDAVLVRIAP